jgi:hypothetical protein
MTFDTFVTGVRAFECAFRVRTSSFVHGLMTRRAVFAFAGLGDFALLTVFFKALTIIQILRLNAAQVGMRCGDKKADLLTYSIACRVECDGVAASRKTGCRAQFTR